MNKEVLNWDWKNVGEISLPEDVFASFVRQDLIAEVVKWQMHKQRAATAHTKTRSEVSGTTRKPWAQKETGRSRQGSLRSPHFRGGGVVFGPRAGKRDLFLNKKIKKTALQSVLSDKQNSEALHVVENFQMPFVKTKEFVKWKNERGFDSILFLVGDECSENFGRAFSNVPYCDILPVRGLNVLSCLKRSHLICDVSSVMQITERLSESLNLQDEENMELDLQDDAKSAFSKEHEAQGGILG